MCFYITIIINLKHLQCYNVHIDVKCRHLKLQLNDITHRLCILLQLHACYFQVRDMLITDV